MTQHDRTIETVKAAVMQALASAGVAKVTIAYNGSGDEGETEVPEAYDDSDKIVNLRSFPYVALAPEVYAARTHDLEDAVQAFGDYILEQKYGGWENNDGAEGTITLDVPTDAVTVKHGTRETVINYSEDVF